MALIDDIAQYLEDEGVGTLGNNLFKTYMPDTGMSMCVCVLDTGGLEPDAYLPTHEPTFQVYIRADSYSAGKSKLEDVREALHRQGNLVSGDSHIYFILAQSEGGHIGRNDRGQDEFSINFRCRTR